MRINIYCLLLLLFLTAESQHTFAQTTKICVPSKLTDDDARILLYVTPIAVYTRAHGADVSFEQTMPFKEYPASDYFVATIVSDKPSNSVLGNGILENFAVDKRSGVVETLSDFTEVKGNELAHIQAWIRHGHCIHVEGR